MHHVRVPLDLHQTIHRYGPGPGDTADVVAAEVDEHDVLRALFQVAEQLLLQTPVLRRIRAAPPRAGERPGLDAVALDLDELLGRRADDVPVTTQGEKEHVGRRVDSAQASIDVE